MRKLIVFLVVVGLIGLGAYSGRRGYRAWKVQRALGLARTAFATSDYNKGLLWLRAALNADGNNREAVAMMGDFAELSQSPNAVYWRNRLVEIQPGSWTNQLILARAAVASRDYRMAKKALDGVGEQGRKTPEFQKISGTFAVATGQYPEAEGFFQEALRLEPQNPQLRLNLAMIQVQRTDPQLAGRGRRELESLCTNAAVRADALRHLTLDAYRDTNYARAIPLAAELVREPNSLFSDQLLTLDLLRAARSPQFASTLVSVQQQKATNASQVYELARWMLAGTNPRDTLDWLHSVTPRIQTNLPVAMVVADGYLGTADWAGLQGWAATQFWGDLDYLRLAYLARALREQGLATTAKAEWSKAFKATAARLDRLVVLQRVTTAWDWKAELEEVLWTIVNKFPAEKPALVMLSNVLIEGGKTVSLLTLYAQEAKADPNDLAAKNNLASIALLLDKPEHHPHELAREVYEKAKDNAAFASTYAYSLHVQKKTTEGLHVLQQLKPGTLERPDIAGYYGLMLSASGDQTTGRRYLEMAIASRLLPEEVELFRRAGR